MALSPQQLEFLERAAQRPIADTGLSGQPARRTQQLSPEALDFLERKGQESYAGAEKQAPPAVGLREAAYNGIARGFLNMRGLGDVGETEYFAGLASRVGRGTPLSHMDAVEAAGQTPDSLYEKSAAALGGLAQTMRRREQYPMTEAGARGLSRLAAADGVFETGKAIVQNPLETASGIAQVAVEQAPTIAAAGLTRNAALAAAVSGGSGYMQERYGQLASEAQARGVDISDPNAARGLVRDTTFMEDKQLGGARVG